VQNDQGFVKRSVFDEQLQYAGGATDLHPAILRTMCRPHVSPWIEEFKPYYEDVLASLNELYQTHQDVLILMGMIRAGMDAVICSLVEPGDRIVVASNGFWSDYWIELVESYGGVPVVLREEWGRPWSAQKIRSELHRLEGDAKAFCLTHVETSTGVVNPPQEIGEIVKERGLLYILDCAQSLGGMEVKMDEWGADFCIGGSHKCMSIPAGLAFVGVSEEGWKAIEGREVPIRGRYMNLAHWKHLWAQTPARVSLGAPLLFALGSVLDLIFQQTPQEVYRRHRVAAKAIRSGIRELGLNLFVNCSQCPGCDSPKRFCADTVTVFRYPRGVVHEDFAKIMSQQYGIAIGGGIGKLKGKICRIGPAGLVQILPRNIFALVTSIGLAMRQLGAKVEIQSAIDVVNRVLVPNV
jgi:aspartate aminotransferase-like enzyme